jgi:hypothetical protein
MRRIFLIIMLLSATACMGMRENHATESVRQKVSVSVPVPDSGWRVTIQEVNRVGQELWVVSELRHRDGMAAQVISTVTDSVEVSADSLPVIHYVIGKNWPWTAKGDANKYIDSADDIPGEIRTGECLYKKRE